jgi:DnaJ-class molecular chaperone
VASQQRANASSGSRAAPSGDPFGSETYYSLLNVPYSATRADIRRAYRQAMMRAHPDRARPDQRERAENLAKDLNRAYATLSDPKKRVEYDKSIQADVLQSEIMRQYVGGFGGGGLGGARPSAADAPRREMSAAERREKQVSDRSAMLTIFSVFAVIAIAGIVLLLLFALVSTGLSTVF